MEAINCYKIIKTACPKDKRHDNFRLFVHKQSKYDDQWRRQIKYPNGLGTKCTITKDLSRLSNLTLLGILQMCLGRNEWYICGRIKKGDFLNGQQCRPLLRLMKGGGASSPSFSLYTSFGSCHLAHIQGLPSPEDSSQLALWVFSKRRYWWPQSPQNTTGCLPQASHLVLPFEVVGMQFSYPCHGGTRSLPLLSLQRGFALRLDGSIASMMAAHWKSDVRSDVCHILNGDKAHADTCG